MAAHVSERVPHLVTKAALAEAIDSRLRREKTIADRHAAIAERIARVHSGDTSTFSMDEVERTLREELAF